MLYAKKFTYWTILFKHLPHQAAGAVTGSMNSSGTQLNPNLKQFQHSRPFALCHTLARL